MRENKFRAINTDTGKWVYYGTAINGIVDYLLLDESTESQYTGLKGVGGVEIYEGDIITAHQFLFDGNEVESIIFGEVGSNEFGWALKRIKNDFYEDYTGYEPYEGESNLGDFYGLHEESFKVIGNIYENPKLLESDQ